jgi:hypothetical protein
MSRNVRPNMVMIILRDLIETPLYKDLNITIHHQWASFFALHMNSKSQILTYNNASFDNIDFDNK